VLLLLTILLLLVLLLQGKENTKCANRVSAIAVAAGG
jgi:hypothetical protein